MNKAPVKGQSRYGQVAQAATAVRSKDTIELAFKPIPPTQSKAFDTPVSGVFGNRTRVLTSAPGLESREDY